MTPKPSDRAPNTAANPDDIIAQKFSVAAERNIKPIQDVLAKYLPTSGRVLEIASGTGQHIVAHGAAFPELMWQPTDISAMRRASIEAYRKVMGLENVLPSVHMDACAQGWARQRGPVDVVIVVNLLHLITDVDMAVLLDEASQSLSSNGMLAIYGPFLREGMTTSQGDADFHSELLARHEGLGYKDLGAVASVLEALQLRVSTYPMPANNVMLIARKAD